MVDRVVRKRERDMISGLSDDQSHFMTCFAAPTGCAGPRSRPPTFSFGPMGIGSLYRFIHCYLSADSGVSYVIFFFFPCLHFARLCKVAMLAAGGRILLPVECG